MVGNMQAVRRAAEPQANAARMLLVLAHELRGPLAPIRHAATILAMQMPAGSPSRKAVGVIERQVTAIETLIESVLEAARLDKELSPRRCDRVDVSAVVADSVDAAAPYVAERGHALEVDIAPWPIEIDGDAVQLAQIVSNLITNAVKYTDRGGRIGISVTAFGQCVEICVRDTGIGLHPDTLESIFDLYSQAGQRGATRAAGGLGIGLYVARQLVRAHGGSIVAASPGPNLGSSFSVRLPLARTHSTALRIEAA